MINDIFAKIDLSKQHSTLNIIDRVFHCNEGWKSFRSFLVDLSCHFKDNKFIDNFSTIVLEESELKNSFIHQTFVNIPCDCLVK